MEQGTKAADVYQSGDQSAEERRIARLITSSVAGSRWRDLTPLDIARHLVANGVRVVMPCGGPGPQEYEGPQFGRQWEVCPTCGTMHDEGGAR